VAPSGKVKPFGHGDAVAVAEGEAVAEDVGKAVTEVEGDADGEGREENDAIAEFVATLDTVAVDEEVPEADFVAGAVGDKVVEVESVADGEIECVADGETDSVADGEAECVAEEEGELELVAEADEVADADAVAEDVGTVQEVLSTDTSQTRNELDGLEAPLATQLLSIEQPHARAPVFGSTATQPVKLGCLTHPSSPAHTSQERHESGVPMQPEPSVAHKSFAVQRSPSSQAALVKESPGPGGMDQLVLESDGTQTLQVDGPTLPCASPLSTQVLSITQ